MTGKKALLVAAAEYRTADDAAMVAAKAVDACRSAERRAGNDTRAAERERERLNNVAQETLYKLMEAARRYQ